MILYYLKYSVHIRALLGKVLKQMCKQNQEKWITGQCDADNRFYLKTSKTKSNYVTFLDVHVNSGHRFDSLQIHKVRMLPSWTSGPCRRGPFVLPAPGPGPRPWPRPPASAASSGHPSPGRHNQQHTR